MYFLVVATVPRIILHMEVVIDGKCEATVSIGQQVDMSATYPPSLRAHIPAMVLSLDIMLQKWYRTSNKRSGFPKTGLLTDHPLYAANWEVNEQRFLTATVRCLAHRNVHCPLPTTGDTFDVSSPSHAATCLPCQQAFGQSVLFRSLEPLPETYIVTRVLGKVNRSHRMPTEYVARQMVWPETIRQIALRFKTFDLRPGFSSGRRLCRKRKTKLESGLVNHDCNHPLVRSPEVANLAACRISDKSCDFAST